MKSINLSVNESYQSMSRISHSIYQLMRVHQFINKSIDQSINRSIVQSINHSLVQEGPRGDPYLQGDVRQPLAA